jgi:molybdopterin converting factor small subunit
MSVTVRLYAGIREAAGQSELNVEGRTVAEVRDSLAAALPEVADRLAYCRYALDDTFVAEETAVPDGASVDVIPPVSGG